MLPLVRSARRSALAVSSVVALAAVLAGSVRLLPWLLEPEVPWRAALPFARGVAALALESALVVGWPVGWALACFGAVENGGARVAQTLGEAPLRTVLRFSRHAAVFASALAAVALVSGADAREPGRVASELLAGARSSCVRASTPTAYVVPFTSLAWLCAPGREPRLAGRVPGLSAGAAVTARNARLSGDMRAVELDDARLALKLPSGDRPASAAAVHVQRLSVRGMAPWARADVVPPILRAAILIALAWGTAALSAVGALRPAAHTRAGAIAISVAGPLAGLGLLRALERTNAPAIAFVCIPAAACALAAAATLVVPRVRERFARGARAGRWGLAPPEPRP